MNKNPVGWFEIYVDDMERAHTFYETVFSTTLEKMPVPDGEKELVMHSFPMEMTEFGASGALVKMAGYGPASAGTIVYFMSEDCTTEESKVVEAGGEVMQPKHSLGEFGFMSLLKDCEGNVIGLHSMK